MQEDNKPISTTIQVGIAFMMLLALLVRLLIFVDTHTPFPPEHFNHPAEAFSAP